MFTIKELTAFTRDNAALITIPIELEHRYGKKDKYSTLEVTGIPIMNDNITQLLYACGHADVILLALCDAIKHLISSGNNDSNIFLGPMLDFAFAQRHHTGVDQEEIRTEVVTDYNHIIDDFTRLDELYARAQHKIFKDYSEGNFRFDKGFIFGSSSAQAMADIFLSNLRDRISNYSPNSTRTLRSFIATYDHINDIFSGRDVSFSRIRRQIVGNTFMQHVDRCLLNKMTLQEKIGSNFKEAVARYLEEGKALL